MPGNASRVVQQALRLGLLKAIFLIAGCATLTPTPAELNLHADRYAGRLGLTVLSEPSQTFSAGFDLEGAPEAGTLALRSPLGNTLAELRWQPGEALLIQGEQTHRYDSLDDLMTQLTGAPIPVRALFAWLRGEPGEAPGWHVELTRAAEGRIQARRSHPAPEAELRLVLDR